MGVGNLSEKNDFFPEIFALYEKKGSMIDSVAKKSVEKSVIENSCSVMKKVGRFREEEKIPADTKQAYLYGYMGDDIVYIRPPDWWPELVQEGYVFLLLKSIYGTRQSARKWHTHILTWMEQNGYSAVNSEKTIFMKRKGDEYIIHGLFDVT